jgi:hypothetical protein
MQAWPSQPNSCGADIDGWTIADNASINSTHRQLMQQEFPAARITVIEQAVSTALN